MLIQKSSGDNAVERKNSGLSSVEPEKKVGFKALNLKTSGVNGVLTGK